MMNRMMVRDLVSRAGRGVAAACVGIGAACFAHAAGAETLFADTFDRKPGERQDGSDLNTNDRGKVGSLGRLQWKGRVFNSVMDIKANRLRINTNGDDGNFGGSAWLEHNFIGLSEFSITVDIDAQKSNGNGRYMSISVGQSLDNVQNVNKATPSNRPADFSVAYDSIGTVKGVIVYLAGKPLEKVKVTPHPPDKLSVKFAYDDMKAGTTLNYEVLVNGISITTGSTKWSGTDENYISLQSNSTEDSYFDNFVVRGTVAGKAKEEPAEEAPAEAPAQTPAEPAAEPEQASPDAAAADQ